MSHSRLTRDSLEGAAERPHMRESRTYVFSDEHNCDHAYVRLADHDAALRRAKADGLEQVSELRKALELYRDASYQGHSSHWDKTGGSGSGCPACLRAIELRAQARQIVDTLDARAAQIEADYE